MSDSQNQLTDTFESFTPDGLELVVNTTTGMAYASISATARMLNKPESTVRGWCNGGSRKYNTTEALIPTGSGVQGARLIDAVTLYDMASEYNPELAKQMGRVGANIYLLNRAGYKVSIKETIPTAPPIPPTRRELAAMLLDAEIRAEKAEKQIEADSDFTNLGKLIDNTVGCVTVGEFAKVIEVGRSTYFNELRHCKILMKNSVIPFQNMMAAGYFVVTEKIGLNNIAYPTTLITAKGQTYLAKRHKQYLAKELVTVQMEREVNLV
jgi:phage antirepressor YoqD-like protein